MENILGYIKWRGDLTFNERSFNDVDNLVFCQIAYPTLPFLTPSDSITIKDAYQGYLKEEHSYYDEFYIDVLRDASNVPRYQEILITDYTDILDKEKNIQFAAMCFHLPGNIHYVAYRGTDFSIAGWHEDFNLSFQVVEAQTMAMNYLNEMMKKYKGNFYIGGHSKGGNLAIYAGVMCNDSYKKRIIQIYSNDGPGFCPENINQKKWQLIANKMIRIAPEYSVVGNLFYKEPAQQIVLSENSGPMQHAGVSWMVEGEHFVTTIEYDSHARFFNEVIAKWLDDQDEEHRMNFVNELFAAFEASGKDTFNGLNDIAFGNLERFLSALAHSNSSSKESFKSLLQVFSTTLNQNVNQNIRHVTSGIPERLGIQLKEKLSFNKIQESQEKKEL